MIDKDILNALADALMGTGSTKTTNVKRKWYVCVPDGKGGTKKQEAASLFHAEVTVTPVSDAFVTTQSVSLSNLSL